jgi:chemotaxis response regulator CheB
VAAALMAARLGLAVATEFRRLVLRQLLRRIPGIVLAGEAETLAEAQSLPGVDALIVDAAACGSNPAELTALTRLFPGRVILIGEVPTAPPNVPRLPDADIPRLTTGLRTALASMAGITPRAADPVTKTTGRVRRPELVLIAASTGGPDALQTLFEALHRPACPIVIALHIPAEHCTGLARHLSSATGHAVKVGEPGPLAAAEFVLLRGGADYAVSVRDGALWLRGASPAASVFHPNGDVLLRSGAVLDRSVVGIVLTGMGNDGCAGAKALAEAGHPVLAQTPASCAVPGMPAAAIAAGAVRDVASLTGIADRLNAWFALPA